MISELAALLNKARPLFEHVQAAGGLPVVVGGAVRDAVLGQPSDDLDIEVYQLDAAALQQALAPLGHARAVGRSFGALKVRIDGHSFDVVIPQRRSFNASGERGAMPLPDPTMSPREAALRRDFTCNALALRPDGELLDFFGGVDDLRAGVLRHVSELFGEDPLRVLRGMRLAARFGMRLAPETAALCRGLLPEAANLSIERVWGEWAKWARGAFPKTGLRALEASGWLDAYPELLALRGCEQSPTYHPEGDAWTHTGYVCDAAAQIARREQLADPLPLLFAALCHDLGKPATTVITDDGRIRSPGHADAGLEPARRLLARIGAPGELVRLVLPLVADHMSHYKAPSARATRRLAARLAPATVEQWAMLVEADHGGRPPLPPKNPALPVLAMAREFAIAERPPPPLLTGKLLIAAGYAPGPGLGPLLKRAYEAQLEGEFASEEAGLAWLAATTP